MFEKCMLKNIPIYQSPINILERSIYEYFRKIFKFNFNLGFCSPKTDGCSFCERVRNQIKHQDAVWRLILVVVKT